MEGVEQKQKKISLRKLLIKNCIPTDYRFFELNYGFQNLAFRFPQAKVSRNFRNPDHLAFLAPEEE